MKHGLRSEGLWRATLGLACVATAACSGNATPAGSAAAGAITHSAPPPPAPPAEPPGPPRFVVVDSGAELCQSPRLDRASCAQRPAAVVWAARGGIARLVEDRGDWAIVETLDPWDVVDHCAGASNELLEQTGLHLRFHVQKAALLPVTVAQVLEYPNGTRVELRGGIPVKKVESKTPSGGALLEMYAAGLPFLVSSLPKGTQIAYEATPPFPVAAQPSMVKRDLAMRYGAPLPPIPTGQDDEPGVDRYTSLPEGEGLLRNPFQPTDVYAEWPHAEGKLVELRSTCAIARVVVSPEAILPNDNTRSARRVSLAESVRRSTRYPQDHHYRIRAGAPLTFRDGTPAGKVGELSAPIPGDETVVGSRRCFSRKLFLEGSRSDKVTPAEREHARYEICAQDADLMPRPRFLTDAAAAQILPQTRSYLSVEVISEPSVDPKEAETDGRGAFEDVFLVLGDYAVAPPGESRADADRKAREHHLARLHVKVRVRPLQVGTNAPTTIGKTTMPASASVRDTIGLEVTLKDASTLTLDYPIVRSLGVEHPAGQPIGAGVLRELLADNLLHAAVFVRARVLGGARPGDLGEVTSLRDLPGWVLPLGFGHDLPASPQGR